MSPATCRRIRHDPEETVGLSQAWVSILKEAAAQIEAQDERLLRSTTPTGAIFALKQRGWTDQVQIEHSGSVGGLEIHLDLSAALEGDE